MKCLYAIQAESGPIKLGISVHPQSRLSQLQTASHEPLALIATTRGTEADEAALHSLFAESRLRGEWFADSPHLRKVLAEWDEPLDTHDQWASITGFYSAVLPSRTDAFLGWFGNAWDRTLVQSDLVSAFVDTACANAALYAGDRMMGPDGDPFFLLERPYMRMLWLGDGTTDVVGRMTVTFDGIDHEAEVQFVRGRPSVPLEGQTLRVPVMGGHRRSMLSAMTSARHFLATLVPGP